jgi:hypothetical protein
MEAQRFDHFARSLGRSTARRRLLAGLAVSPIAGLLAAGHFDRVVAKKKQKKSKKAPRPVFNEFGCLDVGQPCRGNGTLCCSGVCKGKKPKKGKRDTRTCAAHHTGDCTPQRNYCTPEHPPVLALCNLPADTAFCMVTTGNAAFCASLLGFDEAVHCQACTKDADCLTLGFPPGSACVQTGGQCTACGATQDRACFPPAGPA